ncbi:hypothetical protein Ahy_A03g016099 [Arachis hypogaea]|uniref:glutathione gamma-glutamylcysteinyltransferase n=1 Tax=Arachis hypogaea TaxID=3818 RepID=A0A445E292_ARAHY|nr:hypothetical protein Ahy_A03g016099 [Arachis hypogaea]
MMLNGFYKRLLPSPPAIDFVSNNGKFFTCIQLRDKLFLEAYQNGTMQGFNSLISHFQTQTELTYCGLTSLTMVLNSLAIDPGRKWKGPWRWFDESMLDYCGPLETVRANGISFEKLASLGHCAGAKVEAFRASNITIDDFRKYVTKCSTTDDCHIIASYHRAALKQLFSSGSCLYQGLTRNLTCLNNLECIDWIAEIKKPEGVVPILSTNGKSGFADKLYINLSYDLYV